MPVTHSRDALKDGLPGKDGEMPAMMETLKIIHVLCLMGGGAASIGNGLLMRRLLAEGGPPPAMVAATMRTLGKIGLGAIVVLWMTGVAMMTLRYGGGAELGWAFYVKMAAATVVLGAIGVISVLATRAERTGGMPDPARIKPLALAAFVGSIVAVILAVIAFS